MTPLPERLRTLSPMSAAGHYPPLAATPEEAYYLPGVNVVGERPTGPNIGAVSQYSRRWISDVLPRALGLPDRQQALEAAGLLAGLFSGQPGAWDVAGRAAGETVTHPVELGLSIGDYMAQNPVETAIGMGASLLPGLPRMLGSPRLSALLPAAGKARPFRRRTAQHRATD